MHIFLLAACNGGRDKPTYRDTTISSTTSGTYSTPGSAAYVLSNCPGYTDFTNLFDQSQINKVKIDFMPNLTGNPANSLPGLYNLFFMAVDHTDLTVPVQANHIMQYDQHRIV